MTRSQLEQEPEPQTLPRLTSIGQAWMHWLIQGKLKSNTCYWLLLTVLLNILLWRMNLKCAYPENVHCTESESIFHFYSLQLSWRHSSESFQSHLSFPAMGNTLIQTLTVTHLISAVSSEIETKLRGVVNVPLISPQQRAFNPLIIAAEQVKRSCVELVEHYLGKRQGRDPHPPIPSLTPTPKLHPQYLVQ